MARTENTTLCQIVIFEARGHPPLDSIHHGLRSGFGQAAKPVYKGYNER